MTIEEMNDVIQEYCGSCDQCAIIQQCRSVYGYFMKNEEICKEAYEIVMNLSQNKSDDELECIDCKHYNQDAELPPCCECRNGVPMSDPRYECLSLLWEPADVPDNVNHPKHYETGEFECIDVMLETQGEEAVKAYCLCAAFKYLYRHRFKNGVEDIKKARWYLDKFIELEDKQDD